jgi:CHAT domain-containing protein
VVLFRSVAAYTRGLAGEDTAATRGSLWMRIPGTGVEVKTIAGLLDAQDFFLGADATEARFKDEGPRGARFVHVASHGTMGEGGAGQPALVLSLIGNESEDGFLTMTEVFNLKVPAETVVLSACKTGQGVMERGEGVAGLSRAFLYAGANSLVVSLWSVADEETKNLMVDFYTRLKSGEAPGAALNAARRTMISAGMHPYYWAPFVFVGGRER